MSVAILGGGITGLATGYCLAKRGIRSRVFESSRSVGGLGATFRSGPFAFDLGPHEFCTDNPELIALVEELLGPDLLIVERRTAQHFRGSLLRYPFELADLLRKVEVGVGLLAVSDVVRARAAGLFRRRPEGDFETWVKARFGATLYDLYFGPYTTKVWGREPRLIDARTASARISAESAWDLTRKTLGYHLLRREDFANIHSEHMRTFRYARGGIGTLQQRLRERFLALGGEVHTGKKAVKLHNERGAAKRVEFEDGTSFEEFDALVSTLPLTQLLPMALGSRGAALVAERELPFRGMAFVFLRLAKPELTEFHWVYYPDATIPFQRATEFSHFGAGMTPSGATSVTLEVACDPGDRLWSLSDEDLAGACIQSLTKLGQVVPRDVLGFDVLRTPHAYPVQVCGFRERADELLDALGELDNLSSIGRQGLFRYCNMNECMEMSMEVADALIAGRESLRIDSEPTWTGVHKREPALMRQGA